MHPRNRHQDKYQFDKLIARVPALQNHTKLNPSGIPTIDFASAEAVKLLNKALLMDFACVQFWDIPDGFLCPPIPGRADYIHHLADLISDGVSQLKRGPSVRGLDIGVGANCIYPILGVAEYDWNFVGSEVSKESFKNANTILEANPELASKIELRIQSNPRHIFNGIIKPGEYFDFTMCNPPFHKSREDAAAINKKKWQKLGKSHHKQNVNFGGQDSELWTEGGEEKFILLMIEESDRFRKQCDWFTTWVSKKETLPRLERELTLKKVKTVKIIPMEQGQKKSRILAWRF